MRPFRHHPSPRHANATPIRHSPQAGTAKQSQASARTAGRRRRPSQQQAAGAGASASVTPTVPTIWLYHTSDKPSRSHPAAYLPRTQPMVTRRSSRATARRRCNTGGRLRYPTPCCRRRARGNTEPAPLTATASLSAISGTFECLFKRLFIFPSRYLFAIGLPPIFSLRWNLPPSLVCIPKQTDSTKAGRTSPASSHSRGYHPPWRAVPGKLLPVPRLTHASSDYKSERPVAAQISNVGSSRFSRPY